jgi:hypothetical protein
MASITSGELADCDWLRSIFSGQLFSHTGPAVYILRKSKRMYFIKQNSKTG